MGPEGSDDAQCSVRGASETFAGAVGGRVAASIRSSVVFIVDSRDDGKRRGCVDSCFFHTKNNECKPLRGSVFGTTVRFMLICPSEVHQKNGAQPHVTSIFYIESESYTSTRPHGYLTYALQSQTYQTICTQNATVQSESSKHNQ